MTRQIDTDAVNNSVRLKEQASDPSTPAAGYRNIYVKSSGLYLIDDAGNAMQITPDVIGTAYQILRVNSGATGVEYASVGRVLIAESTPTSTGTVTWSSIPATYKSLEIEAVVRSTKGASVFDSMEMRFNNDTTATNYRYVRYGATTAVFTSTGDDATMAITPATSSPAGSCAQLFFKVTDYAGTTFNKQRYSVVTYREDASSVHEVIIQYAGEWESTAAINRVDLVLASGNYATGSTFRLYGVY